MGLAMTMCLAWIGAILGNPCGHPTICPVSYPSPQGRYIVEWKGVLTTRKAFVLDKEAVAAAEMLYFSRLIKSWRNPSYNDPVTDFDLSPRTTLYFERVSYIFEMTAYIALAANLSDAESVHQDCEWPSDVSLGYEPTNHALWMVELRDAAGFPFRSMGSVTRLAPLMEEPPHYSSIVRGGFPFVDQGKLWHLRSADPDRASALAQWRVLPFGPMLPGVVLDTGFWAGVAAAVRVTWMAVLHRRRRLRGQCPYCRYPTRDLSCERCPECGRRVSTAVLKKSGGARSRPEH